MGENSESVFSKIYREKIWGSGSEMNPLSGKGSNPDFAKPYVDFIRNLISSKKILSVLDLGHGDWVMWRDYKFDDTFYLGLDVADDLSNMNTLKFGNEKRVFKKVSSDAILPSAELLICKDVLQHLSLREIDKILSQFNKFRYVVLCNDIRISIKLTKKIRYYLQIRTRLRSLKQLKFPFYIAKFPYNNSDINSGGHRGLDFEAYPFAPMILKDFKIVKKIDFNSEHSDGTKKRILFFENLG